MTPKALRAQLFFMMLLEYAVWGAWAGVAGKYFTDPRPQGLGFPGAFSGLLFSLLPLGSILSPVLIGQLADKWVRAERLLGWLCLLCGGVLFALGNARQEGPMIWLMLLYAMLFAPSVSLTNTIALTHIKNPAKEFGPVRVGGTLGWFVALAFLSIWRAAPFSVTGDLFFLAAGFSVALGIYSFTLPATPPQHTGGGLPFLQATSLLKDRNFRVFGFCAFALCITLDTYYIFSSAFLGTPVRLGGVGLPNEWVPILMMLPQVSEVVVMFSLGSTLPKLGIKRALLIGFSAWILRFALFALFPGVATAAVALLLHGFCFTFVFAVASLYVNEIAAPAIRASAQALVTIGLFGMGRFVGSQLAGRVHDAFTSPVLVQIGGTDYHQQTSWLGMYGVAGIMASLAAIALAAFFREPRTAPSSDHLQ